MSDSTKNLNGKGGAQEGHCEVNKDFYQRTKTKW